MQAQHSAARHPVPSSARARRGAGPASEPTAYEVVLPELPEQHGRAQVLRRVGVVLQMPGGKVRVLPWRAGGPLSDELSAELGRMDADPDPRSWGARPGARLSVSPRAIPWRDMLAGVLPIAR